MQSRYTQVRDGELLSVGEAAAELQVHCDTIRRWDKAGKITAIRTPTGHRRFLASDIAAVKNGEQPATKAPA